eukprot:NODE_657_length_4970_cov_0.583453.p5 type:complete len:106 gc:universal NODE_657_length_4970_cov_0.583453:1252-935(-)
MPDQVISINLVVTRVFYKASSVIVASSIMYNDTESLFSEMATKSITANNLTKFPNPVIFEFKLTFRLIIRVSVDVLLLIGLFYGNYSLEQHKRNPKKPFSADYTF